MKTFFIMKMVALVFASTLLVACASTRDSESAGEFIDSAAITTKVKAELALSDDTSALEIEVDTFKDVVQLSGFVDSQNEKDAAGEIAKSVDGVSRVENSLIVKPASSNS